ncbi:PREDICTED: uncharacterized protein LOC108358381 [Rhagoletis zephyria]|uniref:uncharacterized protein LOC108358381 n=1 Tax=Rhagoletis zephyria TaxID=28612 RepID=UPI0008113718|nr:PREDICTED: uncharacterized protein LOC108358381 [Rhagoletis zephyria]
MSWLPTCNTDDRPTPTLLASLQTFLADQRMTNLIAIFSNFYTEHNFYRYHPFPSGHWALEFLDKTDRYFLCHYANMQGTTFKTLSIQIAPLAIIYEDAACKQRLSGYVGYLMIAFAKKYNFTWQYIHPVIQGNNLSINDLGTYVLEGKLDFAITLSPASYRPEERYPYMSYTAKYMDWFIALPCPQPIAYSEIYTVIVTTQVIGILMILDLLFSMLETFMKHTFYKRSAEFNLANILINVNIMRGIFGLSFLIRRRPILSLKMLYIWLFLLGLFVNNMYSAYFQTLFTSPPLEQKILSFDDMRRANLKVIVFQDFLQLEDGETYARHRSAFDTTYAYSMPEILWPIFELQQQTFQRKIFCLAPPLKFFDHLLLSIPLAENSHLTEPLNSLIMRTMETGLLDHWHTMTFVNLWATGKLSLKDNSSIEQFHNIRVEDFKFPWYLLFCGLGVSSLGLLMEICVHKLKMRTRCNHGKGKIIFKLRQI